MKKTVFFALAILMVAAGTASAADVHITPGTPLWQAIQNANAGDTIHLAAGTYFDTYVWITKSLTIMGDPYAVLDGQNSGKFCFQVQAPDVTIKNLEIKRYSVGIQPLKSLSLGGLIVENCNIHHGYGAGANIGILLTNLNDIFTSVLIKDCQIHDNRVGISIQDKGRIDDLRIQNCSVDYNGERNLFVTNVTIPAFAIEDSTFDHSSVWDGIDFQSAASDIGNFSIAGGSVSFNKQCGFVINQSAHQFDSVVFDGVTIAGNLASGVLLGGGATAGSLLVTNCQIKDNGWEEFDLSGGWFGAFSVTGGALFTNNVFSGSAWAKLYIGDAGVFPGGISLHCNQFLGGSGKYGVANAKPGLVIDAVNNYWGSASGPAPYGSGTRVGWTGTINVTPWLTGPEVAVDPAGHDFGDVAVGQTATTTFVVTNDAACVFDLTIGSVGISGTNAAQFVIQPAVTTPFVLKPGESRTVTVVFTALQGAQSASLDIGSDDPARPLSAQLLTGTGILSIPGFAVEEAKIDWKKKPDDDKIMVKGSFVLPPGSNGVAAGEPVTVVVGKFTQTIVMEEKGKGKNWEFHRAKGDTGIKDMKVEFKKNEITFEMHVDKEELAAMSDWDNPVLVSLRIGDDLGEATVLLVEHKDKWEYHK